MYQARSFNTRPQNPFTPAWLQSHTPFLVLLRDISARLSPGEPLSMPSLVSSRRSIIAYLASLSYSPSVLCIVTITVKLSAGIWGQDVSFFSFYQHPFFGITGPLPISPATFEAKMLLDYDVSQARTFDTKAQNHFTPASPRSHTPSHFISYVSIVSYYFHSSCF